MEKSHTYGGVVVYPAPPQNLNNSHFFITMPDLMFGCAEQHPAFPQRLLVPPSLENGSEPRGRGSSGIFLSNLWKILAQPGDSWVSSLGEPLRKWHIAEEG